MVRCSRLLERTQGWVLHLLFVLWNLFLGEGYLSQNSTGLPDSSFHLSFPLSLTRPFISTSQSYIPNGLCPFHWIGLGLSWRSEDPALSWDIFAQASHTQENFPCKPPVSIGSLLSTLLTSKQSNPAGIRKCDLSRAPPWSLSFSWKQKEKKINPKQVIIWNSFLI